MKNMKNKKAGFTLIEILVVIGIIAILATIVLIAINPARQFAQANDTQRTSNVNAILNAIGQYIADNKGMLPKGAEVTPVEITDTPKVISKSSGIDLCKALVPNYLPSLPVDPRETDGAVVNCDSAYNTQYSVVKATSTSRITVSAVGEVTPATPISVTR